MALENCDLKLKEEEVMTLHLDGWTDVWSNSILGLIHLFGCSESDILEILDFSSERHTVENVLLKVSNIVNSSCINWAKLSAAALIAQAPWFKFCCLLNERHKHVIVLPYTLHALNLMTKDLCKFGDAVPVVKSKCMIVNFFTSSHVWFHNSKEWVKKNGTNGKCKYDSLDSLCDTQWYSMTKVCLGVDTYEYFFFQSKENAGTDENHLSIK